MAKTYAPPYVQNPQNGFKTLLTADASLTAPTTQGQVLLTGATDNTRIDGIVARPLGTNVPSVLRIFLNDGLGLLAANFALIAEVKLPATTANAADSLLSNEIKLYPFNYDNAGGGQLPAVLKASQKLYASIGTTVAAGWAITGYGGDF